ncbi:hypothetical protein AS026_13940 [Rhizobium altiplani]|uniref:Uncharacterized protein n=1 Tax=Rhizobium altiplani TaxID=1864509 RepID=A0A109JDT7_9HYPH|nr:hypothetical protein [Rhizobium altiplani]KWV47066.1 hypothetical protein AS026_13940 [Rhizobium altiplani]
MSVESDTKPKPPDIEELQMRIWSLNDDVRYLEGERDALEESVAELIDLLRKVRVMIRKPAPDLEFIELLIEREIGF